MAEKIIPFLSSTFKMKKTMRQSNFLFYLIGSVWCVSCTQQRSFHDVDITVIEENIRKAGEETTFEEMFPRHFILAKRKMDNCWFVTGTPTYLMELLKNRDYDLVLYYTLTTSTLSMRAPSMSIISIRKSCHTRRSPVSGI